MSGAVLGPADVRPARSRWGDLRLRAASGIVLVAVAVATTWAGGGLFAAAWLAAAAGVNWEWQGLVGGRRRRARVVVGALALAAVAALAALPVASLPVAPLLVAPLPASAAILAAACGLAALLAGPGARLWAAGGLLYAGLLLLAILALRFSAPFGARAVAWLFATVWSTDVFAYAGGRLIGGPRLWPRVSPSKTWSGTLTGVAAGTLAGTLVAMRDLTAPPAALVVLTLAAAALSQAGDAFESGVKRRFGVKDSGHLIPGHGGLMDRLDGFIAAAVFAFAIGLARHMPSTAGGLFSWA